MKLVLNLETGEEQYFDETNSSEDALVNAFICGEKKISQLHDENYRRALKKEILTCMGRTMTLGDYSTIKK
jgi:hypothetical protein